MDGERIQELFTAFITYMWEAARNGVYWAEEHQEKYKNPYLVWAACVVLALILYALVRGIEALLGVIFKLVIVVLKLPYRFVMLFIKLILRIVTTIILSILYCLGFTSSGVRSRSVASRGQSAFYGPNTGGVFSTMQSAGTRRR
ncbi:hypothetical protein OH76DRAFT_1410393 [Lentinus brumalis]|uniref:Uncharacterized protein n=1 Tax=Lentinus brumalis TaxID=2498619 RepID=A0A371CSA1_9APHY|nr:hypothetical protein OH76DRAFT_1410393 [Polyporus brumalis]